MFWEPHTCVHELKCNGHTKCILKLNILFHKKEHIKYLVQHFKCIKHDQLWIFILWIFSKFAIMKITRSRKLLLKVSYSCWRGIYLQNTDGDMILLQVVLNLDRKAQQKLPFCNNTHTTPSCKYIKFEFWSFNFSLKNNVFIILKIAFVSYLMNIFWFCEKMLLQWIYKCYYTVILCYPFRDG